jgi:DNA ligase D
VLARRATIVAMPGGAEQVIAIDGHEVTITSPEKVFFSERGETKLDLVNFYVSISDKLMRATRGRPLLLQRFPDGAEGSSFFQKRVPKNAPEWLQTTTVSTVNGTDSNALVAADVAHIAWAVNMGCLGFHVWPYLADEPAFTDELRLDLDPQPGTDFTHVREAAREVKTLLDELGIVGYPKTTGNRGLHVYVRLEKRWDSYDVRRAAVAAARELERRRPDVITAEWWKEDRGERIFVDFNQNCPHKTVFGAWCVRARPGAQVSTPLTWDEVDELHPDDLTVATVPSRPDPWEPMNDVPQSIDPLLEMFAKDRADGLMDAPWPPVYPKQPDEPPRVSRSRAKKD